MSAKTYNMLLLIFSSFFFISSTQAEETLEQKLAQNPLQGAKNFSLPEWFKNSFLELSTDVTEAKAAGKRVILIFQQPGCPYCAKLIEQNLQQNTIQHYIREHFEVIDINIWGDREVTPGAALGSNKPISEKQFAAMLHIWATPSVLFLNEDGGIAFRMDGYYDPQRFLTALYYVAEKQETKLSFGEYYQQQHSRSVRNLFLLKEDFYAQPPHNLSLDNRKKPIIVWFEESDNPDCTRLHTQVLSEPKTRELLKNFHVVQLDRWSNEAIITPSGERTNARDWAKQLRIDYLPSAVFFDNGQEVQRMSAFFKAFHVQSLLDYIASRAYRTEPNFQRYIHSRANHLRSQGETVDLWR